MLDPRFVFLGALLGIAGSVRYAIRTIIGKSAPNRVSFFLWSAASLIGFFAQLDEGVGLPAVLTLVAGVGPGLVFLASFFGRSAPWRISRFDLLCGAAAVAALVVWLALSNPTLAVAFAVLADLLGAVPTVVKAWRAPMTEEPIFYALVAGNGAITLMTIQAWTLATWLFPAYILTLGLSLLLVVLLRRRQLGEPGGERPPVQHESASLR
ncbi:hypothetical protein [Cumulibacter soli]|uniref:hypothetical protein n=1 Tax=Cumulibacter soli TaxID=2546344 RepID=UPI001067E59F|nr:hypothetical protein [Cumulibacter soli]